MIFVTRALKGVLLIAVTAACGSNVRSGEETHVGARSTLASLTSSVDPNECPAGGSVLNYGVDVNGNGILDSSEINGHLNVCNGASGTDNHISHVMNCGRLAFNMGVSFTYYVARTTYGDFYQSGCANYDIYNGNGPENTSVCQSTLMPRGGDSALHFALDTNYTVTEGQWSIRVDDDLSVYAYQYPLDGLGGDSVSSRRVPLNDPNSVCSSTAY